MVSMNDEHQPSNVDPTTDEELSKKQFHGALNGLMSVKKRRKKAWWGISWHRRVGKWQLSLRIGGELVHGGYFTNRCNAVVERNRLVGKWLGPEHGWRTPTVRVRHRRVKEPSGAERKAASIEQMRALNKGTEQ